MQREKHPTECTDKELIDWLRQDQANNVPIGELTRRNTDAINRFNRQSSFLTRAMIILAIISVSIAIFK